MRIDLYTKQAVMMAVLITINMLSNSKAFPQNQSDFPIKEITVFKDGHVLVRHEGAVQTNASGDVVMDYVPVPVLGTFWAYSNDKSGKLLSVSAGKHEVKTEKIATTLGELLEANPGKEVVITERSFNSQQGASYTGTIIGIPGRDADDLDSSSNSDQVILVKTNEGTRAVIFRNIYSVTFKDSYNSKLTIEELNNQLIFDLDWNNRNSTDKANLGLIYVQKGIRWIPSYQVVIDGKGTATVRLQATLINELRDLKNVNLNLVVGVPSFMFKDTLDPMSLRQAAEKLSTYFDQNSAAGLSNTISMTQTARMREIPSRSDDDEPPLNLGPDIPGISGSDDLYIFNLKSISLNKNDRMILPITEFTVKYEDVYALNLPFAPPLDVRQSFNSRQQAELAQLLKAPKVMHKLRFINSSAHPITTAPGLIVKDNQVLAQGLMTYTPVGAATDLDITSSVDIDVKRSDVEIDRVQNAVKRNGYDYARVNLTGTVELTNYRKVPVKLEISRYVLGNVDKADNGGKIERLNAIEDGRWVTPGTVPAWWGWYTWPDWWSMFNGIDHVRWNVTLDSGKNVKLGYTWHYFWR
jgi:hypothetical protein